MGTGSYIAGSGIVVILLLVSCYRNQVKVQLCGPLRLECALTFYLVHQLNATNLCRNMFLTAIVFGADVFDTSLVISGSVGQRMCISGKTWLGETRMVCS